MMFTTPAELYDAIYFTFKDYAAEAAQIGEAIRSLHPGARSILDVACGTGEHARLLASAGFDVDGVEINEEFLQLARTKHPPGRFHAVDMASFELNRAYDVILCMFSSTGYLTSLARVEEALRCFKRHLAPGGIVLVEPWMPPDKMTSGVQSRRVAQSAALRVERRCTTQIEERLCILQFDYVIERDGRMQTLSEVHKLGMYTKEEMLNAFAAAGLRARHQVESPSNRGLYVASAA